MKVKRVIQVVRKDEVGKESDMTRSMTGDERVSLLEDLRREMSKVNQQEYPQKIQRVLTVVRRGKG